jgi:hypothetical protein
MGPAQFSLYLQLKVNGVFLDAFVELTTAAFHESHDQVHNLRSFLGLQSFLICCGAFALAFLERGVEDG